MPPKKKKGGGASSIRDCSYCGATEESVVGSPVHKACSRCRATFYCGQECQKKHWRSGHKQVCIAPEERKASQQPDPKAAAEGDECCICLEVMNKDQKLVLDCGHVYHEECINKLRKIGVQQVCPLCRAKLPDSPEKMFSDGYSIYYQLNKFSDDIQEWSPKNKKEKFEVYKLVRLFEGAAVQGHPIAQLYLGIMFQHGQGVPQNYYTAQKWYLKSAVQGNADAQYTLGYMYRKGMGVPQSDSLSVKWFRKAADQGLAEAYVCLGHMYRGVGAALPQNEILAREYYLKAAYIAQTEGRLKIHRHKDG